MVLVVALVVLIPVTFILWISTSIYGAINGDYHPPEPWRLMLSVLAPMCIAMYGLKKKSLSPSGAAAGLVVGFILTLSNVCFFAALFAFFLAGSKATKFRGNLKRSLEDNFKEGGQRDWIQVLCNGGVAAWLAILYMMEAGYTEKAINFSRNYTSSCLSVAVLSALSCCSGDTFASELGTVLAKGSPRLITTFSVVPRGTNGGVSLAGTVASAAGGIMVGLAYYITLILMMEDLPLMENPPQWPLLPISAFAGVFGSAVDSLLGATFQYSGYHKTRKVIVETPGNNTEHISGLPLLDNHSVNFLSSIITALITPIVASTVWPYF